MRYKKINQKLTKIFGIVLFIGSCTLWSSCSKDEHLNHYSKDQVLIEYRHVLNRVVSDLNSIDPAVSFNPGILSHLLIENKAREIMIPLYNASKSLLKSFQIYDSVNLVLNGDEKKLIIASILIFKNEVASKLPVINENKFKVFSENSIFLEEIDRDELNGCALEIFGLEAGVYGIIKLEGKIVVKNLVALVMKVGLKSLSWVGIAYSVYNFTMCLVEADND